MSEIIEREFMNDRASNHSENRPSAGDMQARVNLQHLARFFLGNGMPGGDVQVYFIPQFDSDHPEYHVHPRYFRNPMTGDRGGAILFTQRLRRCSYDLALMFLEGWLAGQYLLHEDSDSAEFSRNETLFQLPLFALISERGDL